MVIPNFLIIGDIKAGSTSLYYYLKQHPDIYMPSDIKELRYFAYDKENPYHIKAASYRVKTFNEYVGYFEKCTNEKAIGEASPNYLRSPVAANKIKSKIPNVKVIVCLRNPADRLHSLYTMHYRSGLTKKSFDQQLFGEDAGWIKANFYWQDLMRYFDVFDETQIKIILFDDLKMKRAEVVKELYHFLNVDEDFAPDLKVQNKGGMPRNLYLYKAVVKTTKFLKKFGNPPAKLKEIGAHIRTKSLQQIQINPKTEKKILEICKDDIFRTQELIKKDLSIWFET